MSTDASLRISEIFESIQGEGPSAGARCAFLRLAVCNLRCTFCDTKYTWDWKQYDYDREVREMTIADVARELEGRGEARLVITGGEPLLQQPALEALLEMLGDGWVVEVETNGTLAPSQTLAARVAQWNVSPKLENSREPLERRYSEAALTALRDTDRAWLKWVVSTEQDAVEAAALTEKLAWPRSRALFMPLAATRLELLERRERVRELGARHGFAVSPRLHVERWDGRRGV